jgi:hypothetical protein
MYIGGTGIEGLHHLVWELVDNGIDEALAGYATHVIVEMLEDGAIRVTDDGRLRGTWPDAVTGDPVVVDVASLDALALPREEYLCPCDVQGCVVPWVVPCVDP